MKNFTLSQIRGNASKVLAICDRDECVRITRPDGRSYILKRIEPEKHHRINKSYSVAKDIADGRQEFKSGKLRPATASEIMRKIIV